MSDFKYTDLDSDTLIVERISPNNEGCAHIITSEDGAYVAPEDAPAVALAILQAAGIRGMASDDSDPAIAVGHLRRHVGLLKDKAEREAEDAKVDAYRIGLIRAVNPGLVPTRWGVLTDGEKGNWRTQYRAAREFFTRDEHEPISVEALAKALGHELPEQEGP